MSEFDDPSGAMPPPDPEGAAGETQHPDALGGEVSSPLGSDPSGEGAGGIPPSESVPVPTPDPVPDPVPGSVPASGPVHVPVPQERLHRKVIVYWLLSGLLSWLFLSGFLSGGAALVYFKWPDAWPFVGVGVVVLISTLLVWTLISPSLAWARWRFSVDDELLIARYGIFFIEEKAIPISRLQHVDLYRGLLERFFGLTTLIVFTAGTEGAHFRLPGLSVDRARELRDVILAARGDDVI